ncbi:hypothetical protein CYY_009666 [Polysphondylium violaceum]|uniref:Transmembrane protein n=1 Tax=Polysphondylium violaceum TaxID=133409 RepID=A0A8J4PLA8_9MYCE|nr:hypothetical protein CYY_009666 [Polysphondylium violaceum]
MSYMFELFDIVAGARKERGNSNANEQSPPEDHDTPDIQDQDSPSSSSESEVNEDERISDTSSDSDIVGNDVVGNETLKASGEKEKKTNRTRTLSGRGVGLNISNGAIANNQSLLNTSNSSIGAPRSPRRAHSNFSDHHHHHHHQHSNQNLKSSVGSSLKESVDKKSALEDSTTSIEFPNQILTTSKDQNIDKDIEHQKVFVKPESFFLIEIWKETFKYHWGLFIFTIMLTLVSCAYISFYVTFGSKYIFDENKDHWPKWAKVSTVITGIINEQFLVWIGYSILRSQYGHKATRVGLPLAIILGIASACFTGFGRVYEIEGSLNYIPKYLLSIGNILTVSFLIGWKSFKSKMFFVWFSLPFLFLFVILIVYDYFLLKWYMKDSTTDLARSIIRILVHPLITAFCLLFSRFCANQISHIKKPRSIIAFCLIPLCFNTYYSRFFGNTMNSLFSVAISSLIISFADMFWKCSLRARDSFIVRFLCRCSKNASTIMQHNVALYAEYQSFELIYEMASNFVATFLVITFFFTYNPHDIDYGFQFKIMAIQVAFSIFTEIIVAYVSLAFLKIPIVIPWSKRPPGFLFILHYAFLCGLAYSSIRIVNILNGRWIL